MVLSSSSHRGGSFRRGLPFYVHTANVANVVSQVRLRTISGGNRPGHNIIHLAATFLEFLYMNSTSDRAVE